MSANNKSKDNGLASGREFPIRLKAPQAPSNIRGVTWVQESKSVGLDLIGEHFRNESKRYTITSNYIIRVANRHILLGRYRLEALQPLLNVYTNEEIEGVPSDPAGLKIFIDNLPEDKMRNILRDLGERSGVDEVDRLRVLLRFYMYNEPIPAGMTAGLATVQGKPKPRKANPMGGCWV